MARSDLSASTKLALIEKFDEVLGLELTEVVEEYETGPEALERLVRRASLREAGEYAGADSIRAELEEAGFVVEDGEEGSRIRPKAEWEKLTEDRDIVSSAAEGSVAGERKRLAGDNRGHSRLQLC